MSLQQIEFYSKGCFVKRGQQVKSAVEKQNHLCVDNGKEFLSDGSILCQKSSSFFTQNTKNF